MQNYRKSKKELVLEKLGLTKQQISDYFNNPIKMEVPGICNCCNYYDDSWKYITHYGYSEYYPDLGELEHDHDYYLYEKDDILIIKHRFYATGDGTDYFFTFIKNNKNIKLGKANRWDSFLLLCKIFANPQRKLTLYK